MLKANRAVVFLVVLMLFWGCQHVPPVVPHVVRYILISAQTAGSVILCVEVTPGMRLQAPYFGPDILCGETVQDFRQRVRDTRRAN